MCQPISRVRSHDPCCNPATWVQGVGTAVFIPENVEPAYRYPVVVWLESSDSGFEARTWFPLISSRNALAISLQSDCPGAAGRNPSRREIRRVLDCVCESVEDVAEEIAVHPRGLFLAGHGNGAVMAAEVLCSEPERFAGAILVDPTVEAASVALRARSGARRSSMLVATRQDTTTPQQRNRLDLPLGIETVSRLSKSALARHMNHWLMAQLESVAVCPE